MFEVLVRACEGGTTAFSYKGIPIWSTFLTEICPDYHSKHSEVPYTLDPYLDARICSIQDLGCVAQTTGLRSMNLRDELVR